MMTSFLHFMDFIHFSFHSFFLTIFLSYSCTTSFLLALVLVLFHDSKAGSQGRTNKKKSTNRCSCKRVIEKEARRIITFGCSGALVFLS